jgi:hypothetical protein
MHSKHGNLHAEFSTAFPEDVINEWTQMVDDWDIDQRKQNPYVDSVTSK